MNERAQRLDEWTDSTDEELAAYHLKQWDSEKQSTISFEAFVSDRLASSTLVLDVGCGAGGATYTLARRHKTTQFVGMDISEHFFGVARELARQKGLTNLRFVQGDLYAPSQQSSVDGMISLQTLSWLPDYKEPLEVLLRTIKPRWFAVSSLFYEGEVSCRIEVEEHQKGKKTFYNIYSLPRFKAFCQTLGYPISKVQKFEIGIDLPKPANKDLMGTYTRRLLAENMQDFERLQISGPLLMPWYNILGERFLGSSRQSPPG